jgi:hydroxymethylpyrimidine pyrophosphatase-like HAD family hydrolase
MKGATFTAKRRKDGTLPRYKKYRCSNYRLDHRCDFKKVISENVIERMMLKNIEKYLEDAKVRSIQVTDGDTVKIPQYDIEDIHEQIDRLNYSWQTGKIRKVEQYEAQYAELMDKLAEAEAEQGAVVVKDFTKVEAILHDGWEAIYEHLDDEHKRSFWRSFVRKIEIDWTTEKKEITRVEFF